MKSPFISLNVLIIVAAIIVIIIASAIVVGSSFFQKTTIITNQPTTQPTPVISTSTPTSTQLSSITPTISTTNLSLTITPSQIVEGDPVMITITGLNSLTNIKSALLIAPGPNAAGTSNTSSLHFLMYQNVPTAFYGTGINQATGKTTIIVTMENGTKISADFTLGARVRPSESLPVPAQIGGNSTSSQEQLVSNLDKENTELAVVYSNPHITFWDTPFTWPIKATDVPGGIVVTDPFGYNRDSGAETIIHKGTDFKAAPGTPVYAINAGYVRLTQLFSVYGNTVIVDHGMGIQSFYMHLSKMVVTPGEAVKKGQLLGYSGETGYSEGPHLHLTVRINGISIDPMKFYALFGMKL